MKRRKHKTARNRRRTSNRPKSGHPGERHLFMLAPVAEYRGVALIERPGDKRTAWEGREYFTDGCIYLMRRSVVAGMCELVGLPSEAIAKEFLDEQCEYELGEHYSFTEVEEVIGVDERIRRVHAELQWEWDDKQQVFVQVKGWADIRADWGWGKTWPRNESD